MVDKRIKELKEKASKLDKELKLKKEIEEKTKELNKLKKKNVPVKRTQRIVEEITSIPSEINIPKLTSTSFTEKPMSLTGVRTPINDSEKMWVESWWENRKTLDPNFDIDNWFKSSVHMDLKDRNKQIEDFWIGNGGQDSSDFWTGPTMWERSRRI